MQPAYRGVSLFGLVVLVPLVSAAGDVPGWHRVGSAREDFDIRIDREVHHSGNASGRLDCLKKHSSGTGSLEQDFRPDEYFGQRIRVRAWIKGENAGSVIIFVRVDGHEGQILDFGNTQNHAAGGTFDWRQHEVVIDVSPDAAAIQMGLLLRDKGTAWIDDVSVEMVDKTVKRTAPRPSVSRTNPRRAGLFIDHPALNLDFEQ